MSEILTKKLHKNSDRKFSLILAKPKNKADVPKNLWEKSKRIVVNRFREEYVPLYLLNSYKIKIDKLVVNNTYGRPIKFVTELTEDFAKIIGAICSDGHITTKSKADYIIQLVDSDKTAVIAFQKWIENIFGRKYTVNKDYTSNSWRIDINNKIIGRYLVDVIGLPTNKKSDTVRSPKVIMRSTSDIQKAFCVGALTFDGGIDISGNIEFLTRSKQFYLDIVRILKRLNIDAYYKKTSDKNGFWRFHLCRSSPEYKKWLQLFEKGTEKWEKIKENVNGFKKIPTSENEVLETFSRVFPSKNRSFVNISDFFNCLKKAGNCNIEELTKKLNIDKTTTNKYRKVLKDCNIIREEHIEGKKYKIEICFNKNIHEWRIPKRSYNGIGL
jgi:hypothetical protein